MASDSTASKKTAEPDIIYFAAGRTRLSWGVDALWLAAVALVVAAIIPIRWFECSRVSAQIQCEIRTGPTFGEQTHEALPPFSHVRDLGEGRVALSSHETGGTILEDAIRLDPRFVRAIMRINNDATLESIHDSIGWWRAAVMFAVGPIMLLGMALIRRTTRVVVSVDRPAGLLRLRRSRWGGGNAEFELAKLTDVRIDEEREGKFRRVAIVFKDQTTHPIFASHLPGDHHRAFAEELRGRIRRRRA